MTDQVNIMESELHYCLDDEHFTQNAITTDPQAADIIQKYITKATYASTFIHTFIESFTEFI